MPARTLCFLASAALALVLASGSPLATAQTVPPASEPATPPAQAAAPTQAPDAASESGEDGEATFDLASALITPERGFTADEAGRLARERSPQIASAEASATSAAWDAKAQRSGFLPQVQLSAQYRRINRVESNLELFGAGNTDLRFLRVADIQDPAVQDVFRALFESASGDGVNFAQPPNNYALSAGVRVPVSDMFLRVFPSYKAAARIADARAIEVESRSAAVELQAREAFYLYAKALATQLVAAQAHKQAEAQATQAKLFVDAGTAAPVDLMTANARVAAMQSALERAKGAAAIARDRLATLTGVSNQEAAAIREPVTTLPAGPSATLDELLLRARERRAELRAMRKMVEANDRLKVAERNTALPTLSLDGNVLYANPNPRYIPPRTEFKTSWEVGATLAWSPNSVLTGHQRTQRADAELARARADLAALEDGVRTELVQAYEDYKAADAAARASEAQQRAAEETYRVRSATYRVGAGVQIDLLTADLALTQARLDFVNAVLDARIALARLRRATGG